MKCPLCNAPETPVKDEEFYQHFACGSILFRGDEKPCSDGVLCRARCELQDAWGIINVLHMERMDEGEAWPRALGWLRRNEDFQPPNH